MSINPTFKRVLLIFIFLLVVTGSLLGATIVLGEPKLFSGTQPPNLGVHSGRLAPCPNTSNCVSSQSRDSEHYIEPFTYNSPQEALANIKAVTQSFKRTKVIAATDNYLYTEFTIPILGFVDDVEFLLDENDKVIHVRSASRLGESDLGVNRKRIETIRAKLSELKSKNTEQNS